MSYPHCLILHTYTHTQISIQRAQKPPTELFACGFPDWRQGKPTQKNSYYSLNSNKLNSSIYLFQIQVLLEWFYSVALQGMLKMTSLWQDPFQMQRYGIRSISFHFGNLEQIIIRCRPSNLFWIILFECLFEGERWRTVCWNYVWAYKKQMRLIQAIPLPVSFPWRRVCTMNYALNSSSKCSAWPGSCWSSTI